MYFHVESGVYTVRERQVHNFRWHSLHKLPGGVDLCCSSLQLHLPGGAILECWYLQSMSCIEHVTLRQHSSNAVHVQQRLFRTTWRTLYCCRLCSRENRTRRIVH